MGRNGKRLGRNQDASPDCRHIASRVLRSRRFGLGGLLAAVLAILLACASTAAAATFTVNLTGDQSDTNRGNGLCDVASASAGEQCTLRAAVQEGNADDLADRVVFDIGGGTGDVKTITPRVALPKITRPLTIDGYSQPGASANTAATGTNAQLKVVLDGSIVGDFVDGLTVTRPGTTIRGLVINNGFGFGVNLSSVTTDDAGSVVQGCFIGTDVSGTAASPTGGGIQVGTDNVIGGAALSARNLISGSDNYGITLHGLSNRNRIQGNLIGTQRDGTSALGNHTGIYVLGSNNRIGGPGAAANTIASNRARGIQVQPSEPGAGRRNQILYNSIFRNGALGIELGADGITANDLGDLDSGANDLQNFPVLSSAHNTRYLTQIAWSLHSTGETTFKIQFFSNPDSDRAEGEKFIGETTATTDADGETSSILVPGTKVSAGRWITATATDPLGNTSEFSIPMQVRNAPFEG